MVSMSHRFIDRNYVLLFDDNMKFDNKDRVQGP